MATWRDKDVVLCLTGGLLLGVTVSVRMALWGKVTGSSGILAKTFKPNATVPAEERVQAATFTGAMVIGGVAAQHLMPSAFESWESKLTFPFAENLPIFSWVPNPSSQHPPLTSPLLRPPLTPQSHPMQRCPRQCSSWQVCAWDSGRRWVMAVRRVTVSAAFLPSVFAPLWPHAPS